MDLSAAVDTLQVFDNLDCTVRCGVDSFGSVAVLPSDEVVDYRNTGAGPNFEWTVKYNDDWNGWRLVPEESPALAKANGCSESQSGPTPVSVPPSLQPTLSPIRSFRASHQSPLLSRGLGGEGVGLRDAR